VADGTGSGGNIVINTSLMVLDRSRIEANARRGAGGNITIQAGQLLRTPVSGDISEGPPSDMKRSEAFEDLFPDG
jgi:large exoprotein involved in heme utilization and adhesion